MKLSVIIVNYNVEYFLEQCINSALKALSKTTGEIIVVENKNDLLKRMGQKTLLIELQDKITQIPEQLSKYELVIGKDQMSLIYNYNVRAERTGITNLLQELKEAGLKMRDLKTEQSSLEKIFVTLVKENNEI